MSVKNLFPKFEQDDKVMQYMPDSLPKGKFPDRRYFFNVLNTVHYEKTQEMIAHANK